jgi:cyanophycinase
VTGSTKSEVAAHARDGSIVIVTVASSEPEPTWRIYRRVFADMGVDRLQHLDLPTRAAAFRADALELLRDPRVVFFTGGDQGQITTRIAGTPVHDTIQRL